MSDCCLLWPAARPGVILLFPDAPLAVHDGLIEADDDSARSAAVDVGRLRRQQRRRAEEHLRRENKQSG